MTTNTRSRADEVGAAPAALLRDERRTVLEDTRRYIDGLITHGKWSEPQKDALHTVSEYCAKELAVIRAPGLDRPVRGGAALDIGSRPHRGLGGAGVGRARGRRTAVDVVRPWSQADEDARVIRVAEQIATCSDDRDTQTGCVLYSADAGVVSGAANRLPWGTERTPSRTSGDGKRGLLLHAEPRAVANAALQGQSTQGATAVLTWYPCSECAGILVTAGVAAVVGVAWRMDDPRYSFRVAWRVLEDAGVEQRIYDEDGRPWRPPEGWPGTDPVELEPGRGH